MNYMSNGEPPAPPQPRAQGWPDQQQQSQQFQQNSSVAYQEQQPRVAHAVDVPSIKEIERSAMFTFCPSAPFMAAGSVAGAIDLSFSTSSQLEVRPGLCLCGVLGVLDQA